MENYFVKWATDVEEFDVLIDEDFDSYFLTDSSCFNNFSFLGDVFCLSDDISFFDDIVLRLTDDISFFVHDAFFVNKVLPWKLCPSA